MSHLKRLQTGFQIGELFMKGEKELPKSVRDNFVKDINRTIPLDKLDDELDNIIISTDENESRIDQMAAPVIHSNLNLNRREAADLGIWRYLTIIHRPDFVRHRWGYSSRTEMKRRFVGSGRWNSNTFSRLWWVAELTSDNNDYELTRKAFQSQYMARSVFERTFGAYPPSAKAFIEVFHDSSNDDVELSVKRFNQLLTTIQVESMSQRDIEELLLRIKDDVRSN